jgi:hypothetical protein
MQQNNQTPAGWHEGIIQSITIVRRQGKHVGNRYHPSGWDLVDSHTGQVIAEFNDETAPPPDGAMPLRGQHGLVAPDGNELGEMFKEIYRLAYAVTIDAMKLMARALPEHKDSPDGEPIAQIVIGAYNRLPQTIQMTNKEAYNATQPF